MMSKGCPLGLVLALAAAGCASPGLGQAGIEGQGGQAQLSGAIFTTTEDGTRVDANIYADKCDVYLNGGPEHEGAAGLPEGDYYFQVTTPPGNDPPSTLLSTDSIGQRQVHVDSTGRITGVSGAGDHQTGTNQVDGGATIQLCPYLDTTNPGCEYKVWLTPVADYDASAGTFGFLPSRSKTDNFKVCAEEQPGECGNGVVEGDEECDDGNRIDDDDCSNVCTINF